MRIIYIFAHIGGVGRASGGARPESKIALLTGQGVSDSNVLEYLGCIEQRAVDIITDYLRVLQKNKDPSLNILKLTNIPRSPTPGPATAARSFFATSTRVNLDDLGDDDGLDVSADATNFANNNNNNNQESSDNKVIDLDAFKSKMQKKLGLSIKSSASQGKLGKS